jgi:hypothetical protein
MQRSKLTTRAAAKAALGFWRAAVTATLLLCASLSAAPARPFHLVLEANPAAPFPFLGRFGTVTLHVYPGGVRAKTIWLNGFSRNGTPQITVENPYGRMYTEVPVANIATIMGKLAGGDTVAVPTPPPISGPMNGTVHGIAAQRYRIEYGPQAWIDLWTTQTLPETPQLRAIVQQIVRGISPATAAAAAKVPGVPVYVELNFNRFKKLPIVKVKELTFDADGEEDALKSGMLFFHAPLLDSLWK